MTRDVSSRVALLGCMVLLALLSPAAGVLKKSPPKRFPPPPARKPITCYSGVESSAVPIPAMYAPKSVSGSFGACGNATIVVVVPNKKLNITVNVWAGIPMTSVPAVGCSTQCCLPVLSFMGYALLGAVRAANPTNPDFQGITGTPKSTSCCSNKDNCNYFPKSTTGRRMALGGINQRSTLEGFSLGDLSKVFEL